jgi:hypothetical protein
MKFYSVLLIGCLAGTWGGHAVAACRGEVPVSPYGVELLSLPLCYQLQLDVNPQLRVLGLGVSYPASEHIEIATSAVMTLWQAPSLMPNDTMLDTSIRVGQFDRSRYYAEAGITLSDWLNTADKKNDWFAGVGMGYGFQYFDVDLTLRVRQISADHRPLAPNYYRTTLGVSIQF